MIRLRADLQPVMHQLARMATALEPSIDAAIDAALAEVIGRLQPATPVRTGRMQAGYRHAMVSPGSWELSDEMPYSRFVIGGTRFMQPNPSLNAILDDAESMLEAALDVAVTRLVKP
jgi:hypothetical protein